MAKYKRTLSDQEREQRRAEQRELVRASIEQLRSTEGWQAYLKVRSRFHSYSWRNVLLILHQHPTAQRVAGFRAWLNLGYCPMKGSKAISIWAPCPPTKRQLQAWRDAGANPDEKPRGGYKLAAVFDRLSRVRSGDVADAPFGLGPQPRSRCRSSARPGMWEGPGFRLAVVAEPAPGGRRRSGDRARVSPVPRGQRRDKGP